MHKLVSQVESKHEAGRAHAEPGNHATIQKGRDIATTVLEKQRTHGNRYVQRLINAGVLQAKLTVSNPGDPYEQEADRVADQVLSMTGTEVSQHTYESHVSRACQCGQEPQRQAEDAETVQRHAVKEWATKAMHPVEVVLRKSDAPSDLEVSGDWETRVQGLSGSGQPLPETARSFFEPRFGYDFSHVRVHTDGQANEAARAVNALAFTIGPDVVFGDGQYQPNDSKGRRLLAHELTHVVQQQRGDVAPRKLNANGQTRLVEPHSAREDTTMLETEPSIPGLDPDEADIAFRPGLAFLAEREGAASDEPGIMRVASSCDEPLSMNKVTSGAFQGGLTMADYYPDLDGKGYWENGGTAGPFDTGSRVGSNVQLYGTFPSPCKPDLFSLEQTVTYTNTVRDGTHHPKEGVLQDDIAKSGRSATTAPFRQDWLGGGYNASMADPPSFTYGSTTNAEWDRSFVTSLRGPSGTKSVSWSTSIRIENGVVTRNTLA